MVYSTSHLQHNLHVRSIKLQSVVKHIQSMIITYNRISEFKSRNWTLEFARLVVKAAPWSQSDVLFDVLEQPPVQSYLRLEVMCCLPQGPLNRMDPTVDTPLIFSEGPPTMISKLASAKFLK